MTGTKIGKDLTSCCISFRPAASTGHAARADEQGAISEKPKIILLA